MSFATVKKLESLRIDASSACQLHCLACPTHGTGTVPAVGYGTLKLADFRALLHANPHIKDIELANYGEIFLNPELPGILECAWERGVVLHADDGANLNRVSDQVLEGLVKYGFRSLTCSLDGTSQETYGTYRVNGDFATVLRNIQKLNEYKRQYGSRSPALTWQFIVFGHNEHEIALARGMAEALGMAFQLKLSWDPDLAVVGDRSKDLLRKELGAADREEYRERFGADYAEKICEGMWTRPQLNWDGRVLGCCRNFWTDYGTNGFTQDLTEAVNTERLRYARRMLLGEAPARGDTACATCEIYESRRAMNHWVTRDEIYAERRKLRKSRWARTYGGSLPYRLARGAYRVLRPAPQGGLVSSGVYPIDLPLPTHELQNWVAYGVFRGRTKRLPVLTCHVSSLAPGPPPHAPHTHAEEEMLVVLGGELDLIVPAASAGDGGERTRLRAGQFAYYPIGFEHTVQAAGVRPAEYLMFKWSARKRDTRRPLGPGVFTAFAPDDPVGPGFASTMFFSGPTRLLRKLSCHTSTLTPGAGYEPHADAYDVAIVVLEGELETLGRRAGKNAVIFYAEGDLHGLRNVGDAVAKYLVFEFHGGKDPFGSRLRSLLRSWVRRPPALVR